MKNLWKMMVAALVIIGATACTESEEGVDKKQEQSAGVSFYATIGDDTTRAYIDNSDGDKTWSTVWEEGDTLVVRDDTYVYYTFVCTDAATGKFTCSDSGAVTLVGKEVTIRNDYDKHKRDSRLGKKALSVWTTGVEFTPDATIQLSSETSFFRYTYEGEGDVTLKLTLKSQMGDDIKAFEDNGNSVDEITFSGIKGENFVPFWCGIVSPEQGVNATLSYAIDGVIVKQTTIKNISAGKVYNLGTLAMPYEVSATWGIAGAFNGWAVGTPEPMYEVGDMLVAYNLTKLNEGFKFVQNKSWDGAKGSKTQADEVGKWLYSGENDIKTADAAAYDVYFAPARSMYCIVVAGSAVPELPEVEPITWSLAGSFNNWGDTLMTATETANLFVAKGVELKSGDEIKVKDSKTWDTSYGGGITNLEANKWMKAYFNGANIVVAKSGSYDVYFEYAEGAEYSKLYLVDAEGDYTAAVEQTAHGTLVPDGGEDPDPDQPTVTPGEASEWGVVGTFQGWDVAAPLNMVTDVDGWVVLRGLELYKDDEIKIVKGTSWDGNYGLETAADLDVDVEHALKQGGQSNIGCAKNGKFDIYFNANTAKFKYVCVEEYTDLTVNITIDNKANWNPLRLMLKHGDTLLTAAEGDEVTGTTYTISGDYIGATLTYQFFTDGKQSEAASLTVSKSGVTITLEETIVKLTVQLNTANSKQWWGNTMKIHVWSTGTSFDTSWPGRDMTYDGNYTWHVIVPSELVGKSINYLVHNGNGWQSKDSKVTIKAEGVTVTGSSIGIN